MDKIKIIFWVVVALIYFYSRWKKNQSQKPTENPEPSPQPAQYGDIETDEERKTFEELLQEIGDAKKETFEPQFETNTVEKPEYPKQEIFEDSSQSHREFDHKINISELDKAEVVDEPTIEEGLQHRTKFQRTEKYKIKTKYDLASEFRTYLSDSKKIRQAFILKEILTTKF